MCSADLRFGEVSPDPLLGPGRPYSPHRRSRESRGDDPGHALRQHPHRQAGQQGSWPQTRRGDFRPLPRGAPHKPPPDSAMPWLTCSTTAATTWRKRATKSPASGSTLVPQPDTSTATVSKRGWRIAQEDPVAAAISWMLRVGWRKEGPHPHRPDSRAETDRNTKREKRKGPAAEPRGHRCGQAR